MSTEDTRSSVDKVKEAAKAYAGLVGTLITGLIAVGVNEPWGYWLALVGAVATGVGVWATSNAETPAQEEVRLAGEQTLALDALLPADPYEGGYEQAIADDDAS